MAPTRTFTAQQGSRRPVYDLDIASDGAVWVMPPGQKLLVKIDPTTNTVAARYDGTINGGGDVAAIGDTLWITNTGSSELIRVRP